MDGGEKSLDNGNVSDDPDTDWNIVHKGIDVEGFIHTEERCTSSFTRLLGKHPLFLL